MKILRLLCAGVLFASGFLSAQIIPPGTNNVAPLVTGTDLFPLAPGNTWVYSLRGNTTDANETTVTARVLNVQTVNGQTYYQYQFGNDAPIWLRSSQNQLFRLDPATGLETQYLNLNGQIGSLVGQFPEQCGGIAFLQALQQNFRGELGNYTGVTELGYNLNCRDAGITLERYAPGQGLIYREGSTIAGPVVYELVYSNVGGRLTSQTGGVGFSAFVDAPRYSNTGTVPGVVRVRMVFSNTTGQNFPVGFANSQQFDVVIRDSAGTIVSQWSRGRTFMGTQQTRNYVNGDTVFIANLPLTTASNTRVPNGTYTLEAYTTGTPRFSVTLPLIVGEATSTGGGTGTGSGTGGSGTGGSGGSGTGGSGGSGGSGGGSGSGSGGGD